MQRWVWVFNIKKQSNSWSGSFCVSRLASCLTSRDASICGTISWSHDLQHGLEDGRCAPRQFTRFQSLCLFLFVLFLKTKSSMWKRNCIEIPGFRPEMAVCVYVWFCVFERALCVRSVSGVCGGVQTLVLALPDQSRASRNCLKWQRDLNQIR